MESLLEKLSSYNIFNYLFPGILCAVIIDHITEIPIIHSDLLTGMFVYYFIGLVASRIGSLAVEPFMKLIKVIEFAPYSDFITAAKVDSKIEVLSEQNNMYRTLIAVFLLVGFTVLLEEVVACLGLSQTTIKYCMVLLFLALFCFSYSKQTRYLKERIDTYKKSSEG